MSIVLSQAQEKNWDPTLPQMQAISHIYIMYTRFAYQVLPTANLAYGICPNYVAETKGEWQHNINLLILFFM